MDKKSPKTGSLIQLIDKVKSDPNFPDLKFMLSVGDNGDLLTETLQEDLQLTPITKEDLPFYPVYQVLVVGEDPREFADHKSFEKCGYKVFLLNE